jgi:hypothetical protein
MQHDSAPAAANFISLLCYLPRHKSPVAGLGPLHFRLWLFNALKVLREGRIQCSDTWAGDGCRSVSQSGAKEAQPLTANCRLSKSASIPISRRLRNGKPEPIL